MTKLLILLLIMTVNLYGQANSTNVEEDKYIIGGKDAKISDFPFMVVVKTTKAKNRVSSCGGTYIRKLWVLTAAHCLTINKDFPPEVANQSAAKVIMGLEEKDQKNFQTSFSVKLIIHPLYRNWRSPFLNDIALIKINVTFNITHDVKIAKLRTRQMPSQANVTAIGWGATKTTDSQTVATLPKRLQRLDLTVWNANACGEVARKKGVICVGQKGKIPCFGDSGSPLVYKRTVIGVASFGFGCSGRVLVYAAIYNHLSWINETIVKNEKNTETTSASNLNVTHIIYFVILVLTVI